MRRCSFQGDVLAGALSVFIAWTRAYLADTLAQGLEEMPLPEEINPMLLAGFGGCTVSRTASACAFQLKKRSMLAGDMIEHLGTAVDMLFEVAIGGHAAVGMQEK